MTKRPANECSRGVGMESKRKRRYLQGFLNNGAYACTPYRGFILSVSCVEICRDMACHVPTDSRQAKGALPCPIRQLLDHLKQLVELDGLGQLAVETGLCGLITFHLLVITRQCDGFKRR